LIRLGLRANAWQFALLVGLNALVGALVGLERSVLPVIGEREFGLATKTAVLSFLLAFGTAKAVANLVAGELAGRGRKPVLVAGWLLALPVPALLAVAPSWGWVVAANALLGASQGFAWSMTVLMKIDLVGPARRGFALGLNESAGYVGVAVTAFATGALAASYAPRTVVWVGAAALAAAGTLASVFLVRETREHAELEQAALPPAVATHGIAVWAQAGFVNNLNDALVWGLVPLYLAAKGASVTEIGAVAAVYPAVWGVGQLGAGWLSDRSGRRPLIVAGMLVQAVALALFLGPSSYAAAGLLGIGTALVYPTLIAAVSDSVTPRARARAVGANRFWRDIGLVAGAAVAGAVADLAGSGAAILLVAALTAMSGLVVVIAARPLTGAPRFSQMS
jgi:MFS family permease